MHSREVWQKFRGGRLRQISSTVSHHRGLGCFLVGQTTKGQLTPSSNGSEPVPNVRALADRKKVLLQPVFIVVDRGGSSWISEYILGSRLIPSQSTTGQTWTGWFA